MKTKIDESELIKIEKQLNLLDIEGRKLFEIVQNLRELKTSIIKKIIIEGRDLINLNWIVDYNSMYLYTKLKKINLIKICLKYDIHTIQLFDTVYFTFYSENMYINGFKSLSQLVDFVNKYELVVDYNIKEMENKQNLLMKEMKETEKILVVVNNEI